MVFVKHNSLKSDIFFNPIFISGFSGSRFFTVQIFQSPGFSGSRIQGSGPGSGSESGSRVQGPGPGFRSNQFYFIARNFFPINITLFSV